MLLLIDEVLVPFRVPISFLGIPIFFDGLLWLKISHAFAATGAARYFTPPWKETSAKKGISKYLDYQIPSPHNITELALNEMWGLYGKDVEISVVVNIGPGIPNASDCRHIAKRFSWGRPVVTKSPMPPKTGLSSGAKGVTTSPKNIQSNDYAPADEIPHHQSEVSPRIKFDQQLPAPASDTERKTGVARRITFGSKKGVGIEDKLRKDENKIEGDIREKLQHVYPQNTPPYYRLAPESRAPGTAKNDTFSPQASFDATMQYLQTPWVGADMERLGKHVSLESSVPVLGF